MGLLDFGFYTTKLEKEGNGNSSKLKLHRHFLGGPVAKTPYSQSRQLGLMPSQGTKISHDANESSHAAAKDLIGRLMILHPATKIHPSQINKMTLHRSHCFIRAWQFILGGFQFFQWLWILARVLK